MLQFSAEAIGKIRVLRAREPQAPAALRVFLAPGGCHGLSYGMTWESAKKEKDIEVEAEGVRIIMDPLTGFLLRNSRVDYRDTLMQSGFDFINPDAKSTCACGTSFSTEELPGEPGTCATVPGKVR